MSESMPKPAPPRNDGEYIAQFLIPPAQFNILRNLEEITKVFLGWASITLEVFVRRDFGERYLTVGRVLVGYLFIQAALSLANLRLMALMSLSGAEAPEAPPAIHRWFVSSFLLLSLVHLLRIFLRNRAGIPWYSRAHGVSWLQFLIPLSGYRLSDWVLYRFLEPGLCLMIAWFLLPLLLPDGSFTRNWLIFASLGLFFHNNMTYNNMRNKYLDLVDGEIISRHFNEARQTKGGKGASVYQTAGYSVIPVPRVAQEMLTPDIAARVQATLGMPDRPLFSDETPDGE